MRADPVTMTQTGQYRSLALYNVYTALHRYRVVRRQTNNLQDRLRKECDDLNRRLDMKEQDVRQARAVESSLVANLREVEDGAKQ